ncbi:MAG: MarR family transcriptional regulator [Lentisphaerae bacterium]|nr:MarR family transcriptional regulator [Lentisphaerota bacterium]
MKTHRSATPPERPVRRPFCPPDSLPATSLLPLWRRIHQELMIRSQQWGLPSNAAMVLVHLHLHPDESEPAAMASATYFPRQTITFLLDLLERKGLANRKAHPNDRRRKLVALTPKGRKKAESMIRDMIRFESAALARIEDLDVNRLQNFLARYADALAAQNDRELNP